MIADHESLASTLALPHRSVLDRIGRSARTDAVRGPKRVIAELVERSEGLHGSTIRFGPMASSWASRASLARLAQRSVSYADFSQRLSESLRSTLLGSPDA